MSKFLSYEDQMIIAQRLQETSERNMEICEKIRYNILWMVITNSKFCLF